MTDRLEQIKKNQTSPYSSNADCIYLLYELAALRAERDYWKNECAEQDRARTQMAHNSIEKDNRLAALRAENERLSAIAENAQDAALEYGRQRQDAWDEARHLQALLDASEHENERLRGALHRVVDEPWGDDQVAYRCVRLAQEGNDE